ncbi:hypothetical protein N0V93_002950 [Gnomoniopsis smithogilvyi]|uniref:HMG box domain-containing protein n=1 Tax=Gnomoniopsis smithogilvyi TaxID=1191159 RepID=A0A9W8YVR3_9PEZI|nr:hypothetical protein N0V93_002950 [Gnomoniopsis smithogilvyi]
MSIKLLCSGCYAPLLAAGTSPILVSPCLNGDCPFFVRLPEIETMMEDTSMDLSLDSALFPDSQNLPLPDCAYPGFQTPQPPQPTLTSASHIAPASASASVSASESEISELLALTQDNESMSLPSAVSHEQHPFVKLHGSSIHIKRPANSFMLYRSDKLKYWWDANPRARSTGEFVRTIGQLWKQEQDSVKKQYAQRARDLADLHSKTFPDYKYAPRRNDK